MAGFHGMPRACRRAPMATSGQLDGPGPGCAIQGLGARELFAMLGIFGIAWFNRRKRG